MSEVRIVQNLLGSRPGPSTGGKYSFFREKKWGLRVILDKIHPVNFVQNNPLPPFFSRKEEYSPPVDMVPARLPNIFLPVRTL